MFKSCLSCLSSYPLYPIDSSLHALIQAWSNSSGRGKKGVHRKDCQRLGESSAKKMKKMNLFDLKELNVV
jgi:hypothetical protein